VNSNQGGRTVSKNVTVKRMSMPRASQGQIVEESYGWGSDGEYYCRAYDRSDRTVTWYRAADPKAIPEDYDAGGEDFPPPVRFWRKCHAPAEVAE